MNAYHNYLNELINKNKLEFSSNNELNWVNPYTIGVHQQKRDALCENKTWLFKNTKPYYQNISPGCQICGEGKWSCLFITNQCNANCFYCPTSQDNDAQPSTQNLTFNSPTAYAEYISFFNFKGVSFSGGEPFLYFERTLSYIKALREICSPDLYIWVYTNGILVDDSKLKKLADSGLNEIRFDIGATNYNIKNLKTASKFIPIVTVEIPAVPEEKETIISLIPELIQSGVAHINLHQMRLTAYNFSKLVKKSYTYIPAERPLVLESEICALEILQYVYDNNLSIGINYCSFHFKNRFQKAGYRRMILKKILTKNEIITENGFVRVLSADALHYDRIILSDFTENTLEINELIIKDKKYGISRVAATQTWKLDAEALITINKQINNIETAIPNEDRAFEIWQHEQIENGLRDY